MSELGIVLVSKQDSFTRRIVRYDESRVWSKPHREEIVHKSSHEQMVIYALETGRVRKNS